ncbi:hypothetical protein AVEN_198356-1 [Araneus ventricosus]|uniref:Uncharacterized protein n=1 Tax=Araneus ventricosus TaxID=182803 RepID=A0A4Y2WDL1_ARAVE|nr:hypothetical protein AVEN_71754-1 [Araneus ventricosus]GBO35767.1 hypothetical protein AVEN_111132-1 [Araneus ventricosus]GBO35867.1 hypothetical protein AVEN_113783-1 [Araneus ventricosus]GBO35873.1 hypothetical protein AVEN_198356-1 [Araneus ventricosus]
MSGRELPDRMNPDFSFITSMVVSGYAVCQANSCSPLVQQSVHRLVVAVLCFGDVLIGGSGIRCCGRTDHESCELSERHCGSVAPLPWRLSSQLEMEPSSRTTPHVRRLGLCLSGSRSILMNST